MFFGGNDIKEYVDRKSSEIAIFPVAYDGTSTWIKGADKGPFSIIDVSPNLEFYDIETDSEVYKHGIYTAPDIPLDCSPEVMVKRVEKKTLELIDEGKFVVTIGGEHSISAGSVKAHVSRFKDVSVLQLDAHSDLRNEYEGSRYNHACVMARVKEMCPIAQVGIRSMCVEEKANMDRDRVFFAENIVGKTGWFEKVVDKLSKNVYVTIDLDVFDPSIMPSTGTPEPGGLNWYEVTGLLREVCKKRNVIGFDCVEFCPKKEDKSPDFIAAKLIYKFLTYIYYYRKSNVV